MRALLAGEAEGVCSGAGGRATDSSGDMTGERDSPGVVEGVGVGDSCAATIVIPIHAAAIRNPQFAIRDSNIVAPVQIRKQVVAGFAVMQEVIIEVICDKLIV